MLNKVTQICRPILGVSKNYFGSSHGAPVNVNIDKQATWIKFKGDRRLQCVQGIQDTHVPFPGLIPDDPFPYRKNVPWYDLQSFFHYEPYRHSLDHEPNSTTQQGYWTLDEPNDSRFDMIIPFCSALATVFFVFWFRQYADIFAQKSPAEVIIEADTIQAMVDEKLRQKANKIKALEAELGQ